MFLHLLLSLPRFSQTPERGGGREGEGGEGRGGGGEGGKGGREGGEGVVANVPHSLPSAGAYQQECLNV